MLNNKDEKHENLTAIKLPRDGEDLIGKVAVCSVGRPEIITGTQESHFGTCWVGLGLDGKGTWASSRPVIIAESGQEFHDKLLDWFDGKMAYNG